MGLFFQKNKNTPYSMMLKFQKTKNKTTAKKKKNQCQQVKDESVVFCFRK